MIAICRKIEIHLGIFDYENRAEKTEDKLKMAQIIRLAEQLCKEQSAPFRTDDRC